MRVFYSNNRYIIILYQIFKQIIINIKKKALGYFYIDSKRAWKIWFNNNAYIFIF